MNCRAYHLWSCKQNLSLQAAYHKRAVRRKKLNGFLTIYYAHPLQRQDHQFPCQQFHLGVFSVLGHSRPVQKEEQRTDRNFQICPVIFSGKTGERSSWAGGLWPKHTWEETSRSHWWYSDSSPMLKYFGGFIKNLNEITLDRSPRW